jgi:hypothetical protein
MSLTFLLGKKLFLELLINNSIMKKKTYKKEMVKLTNAFNKLSLKHFNALKKIDKYKKQMREVSSEMSEIKNIYENSKK